MKPRVLALSGGGARGLVSIQALKYIERQASKPIHQLFDLIIGVSTGALQALALTKPKPLSAVMLEAAYLELLPKIFDKRFWSINGWLGPEYDAVALENAIRSVVGDEALGRCLIPTAVASYSITARLPVLLTSYGVHAAMDLWQAARAGSAAPTYFAAYSQYVDGGLCANNPALWGAVEAAHLYGCAMTDCAVVSLGTGSTETPIKPSDAAGWGKLGAIEPVLSMCMDGGEDLVDLLLTELLPKDNYLRLQTRISGPMADMDRVDAANLTALRQLGNQIVGARLTELDAMIVRLQR